MNDDPQTALPTYVGDAPQGWGAAVAVRSLLLAFAGAAIALWTGGSAALGAWAPLAASLILWTALLTAAAWAVVGDGSGRVRDDLRLRFAAIDLAIAVLLGIALRSAAVLAEMLAQGAPAPVLPSLLLFDGSLSPMTWVLFVITPVLCAPFIEEVFFRGVLQPAIGKAAQRGLRLARPAATGLSVVVSALLFAGGHLLLNPVGQPVLTFILTFLVGATCGALAAVTGRLAPAIGIHLVFNASGVALTLLGTFG